MPNEIKAAPNEPNKLMDEPYHTYKGTYQELLDKCLGKVTELPRGQIGKMCNGVLHDHQYFTFDSFCKNRATPDGLDWTCKACKSYVTYTDPKHIEYRRKINERLNAKRNKPGRKAARKSVAKAEKNVEAFVKTGHLPDEVEAANRLQNFLAGGSEYEDES